MVLPLTHLPRGKSTQIVWIAAASKRRQQLQALGISPKQSISRLFTSPRGQFSICRTRHKTMVLSRSVMNMIFVVI